MVIGVDASDGLGMATIKGQCSTVITVSVCKMKFLTDSLNSASSSGDSLEAELETALGEGRVFTKTTPPLKIPR